MATLELVVLSLRYSSWSIRPWLALHAAGARFETRTAEVPDLGAQKISSGQIHSSADAESLRGRRAQGSVTGLFPVLWVDGEPIHESLAICEWTAESYPEAKLWPDAPLARAQARSIASEMVGGFSSMRAEMSCHVFGRVPGFVPSPATRAQVERVHELWTEKLERSGGPFLFGRLSIADCMYFPVLTRFTTYGIELPPALASYRDAMYEHTSVRALLERARSAPRLPPYDAYLRALGGDPDAAL